VFVTVSVTRKSCPSHTLPGSTFTTPSSVAAASIVDPAVAVPVTGTDTPPHSVLPDAVTVNTTTPAPVAV